MKIVVGTFVTLDGVYQAPGDPNEDTDGGFKAGGWQMPYFDDDAGKIMSKQMAGNKALLLGRKTYQIFAGYWPGAPADDPFAHQLNSMPKYVVSTTLDKADWQNTTLIKSNVPERIRELKEQPGAGTISVTGSGKLAQSLLQYGLVDEWVLWVHPIVLGTGKRLFEDGVGLHKLQLTETQQTGSGIVILTYKPSGQ